MPFIFAVSGFKNSGKTTLCWKLVSLLRDKGLDVAYLKHTHDKVLSPVATDSGRNRELEVSRGLWGSDGLVIEFGDPHLGKDEILSLAFRGKDIVIMEGGKYLGCPKIWVGPPQDIPDGVPGVLACYSHIQSDTLRTFKPGDTIAVASYIHQLWQRAEGNRIELYIGNKRIPVKDFVSDFLARGLKGMLSALHGVSSFDPGISLFIKEKKME